MLDKKHDGWSFVAKLSLMALVALFALLSAIPGARSPPPVWQLTITATTGGATDPGLGVYTYNNGTLARA